MKTMDITPKQLREVNAACRAIIHNWVPQAELLAFVKDERLYLSEGHKSFFQYMEAEGIPTGTGYALVSAYQFLTLFPLKEGERLPSYGPLVRLHAAMKRGHPDLDFLRESVYSGQMNDQLLMDFLAYENEPSVEENLDMDGVALN
jgi:hypothetical protein